MKKSARLELLRLQSRLLHIPNHNLISTRNHTIAFVLLVKL